MHVLTARNVHTALSHAIWLLTEHGIRRESRNGPVLQFPTPVTTVYEKPCERVLFHAERDANPFLHLYESLWMLAGRNDIKPLLRYAKNFVNYSDDGITQHAAYGHRWRYHFNYIDNSFGITEGGNQLARIAHALQTNHEDRRCVLQMWDPKADLGKQGKDFPCNTTATFQVNPTGALDLTVFCRSNDIIWGAYGANAVHFSFLLEYMALWIGVPVGRYYQVSVNWHGYQNALWEKLEPLGTSVKPYGARVSDPYVEGTVRHDQMFHGTVEEADHHIQGILMEADANTHPAPYNDDEPFFNAARIVLRAHALYKQDGVQHGLEYIQRMGDPKNDWVAAGTQWLERRANKIQS